MKVAMLAPIAWRTPPPHYGPWELGTSLLTEGLMAHGIDVTLFATLDSQTRAVLQGMSPHGYAEDRHDGRAGMGGTARLACPCPVGRHRLSPDWLMVSATRTLHLPLSAA